MRRKSSGLCCLVAIDKPLGLSSHDVVSRVRRVLGETRVGHAGTLDPLASGVLVLGIGQATRLMGLLTLDEKCYEARISFGYETKTDDSEGEMTRRVEPDARLFDAGFARQTLSDLVGDCLQVPPAYSAISLDGKRAYARARAGEKVELAPRHIHIYEAELLSIENEDNQPAWRCRLRVSKGSYIRALARDLGRSLDSAAHLSGLIRTASGPISLKDCISLDELSCQGKKLLPTKELDPARTLGLPVRLLEHTELEDVVCGRKIPAGLVLDLGEGAAQNGLRAPRFSERVSLVWKNKLYGVWECRGAYLLCDTNFPQGVTGVRA
ncbi:tRNA pseudouridine(55) synthase TruB [uncultured Olegusella sp.]|uniref:tRNA pseudouridine(55) synthase TruB n=1 Tax=uncultured Olegusella sp. TaxID=1979846 RepID=UPI0026019BF3|nr:tRNA pseudouridine(55) synthase TruB [uncultured Olegusella sp.]